MFVWPLLGLALVIGAAGSVRAEVDGETDTDAAPEVTGSIAEVGAGVEDADDGGEADTDAAPRQLRLIAREKLVARTADGPFGNEGDTDGNLFLSVGATSASGDLVGDLALTVWSDLDGLSPGGATVFGSTHDAVRGEAYIEVLSLWVGYQTDGLLEEARAGRQVVERGSPVALDGLSVTLDIFDPIVSLFAFGGRTVHFFSLDEERYEDWVGSVGATVRPFEALRLEVDYRLQREGTADHDEIIDQSYGLAAWYRLAEWAQVRAYVRGVDDALSRIGGAAKLGWPGLDVGVEGNIYAQPMELDELNVRDDPYFSTLGQSDPFLRWKVDAWAGIETTLGTYALHLGGNGRHLLDGPESPFNRNLGRLYVLGTAEDLFVEGLFLTLTLERHSVDFDFEGHGVWAFAGAAGYETGEWRAEIGSSYDQYKYTYYQTVDELEDVRTFYADAGVELTDWLEVRARYQFEMLAWNNHTITLSLTQDY